MMSNQQKHQQQFGPPKRENIPKYTDFKLIGNGAFGYVFKAYDLLNNQTVAIKRSQKVGNKVSREYEVLTALKGKPNVIQLLDFFYSVDNKERLIQNSVFEFCDTNLENVLKDLDQKQTYLKLDQIRRLTKEILNGLVHMHSQRILHRDLKPENILLKNNTVKICDFGSSKFLDEKEFKNTPYVVSRYYRAPELIFATTRYNESIDIWAVGCILFELITRTPLFPGDSEGLQILEQACILGSPTESDYQQMEKFIEPRYLNIIKGTTKQTQIDMAILINHKVYQNQKDVQDCVDLIFKMLKWVPSERISAKDAMEHPFLRDTQISQ